MIAAADILKNVTHRPYPLPPGSWMIYQQWDRTLFLHWKIEKDIIRSLVPQKFALDIFEGNAWVSLVAFTVNNTRPKHLFPISFISDFHEVNIRTYVTDGKKQGVYFLNIEAQKSIAVFLSKKISGLPYEKTVMTRTADTFHSVNSNKDFEFSIKYRPLSERSVKTDLDRWLTEKYCVFNEKANRQYIYNVHHPEWEIENIAMEELVTDYTLGVLSLKNKQPDIIHYSKGVPVLIWPREKPETS